MTKQYITRKGSFDAAHRVLHQSSKCKSYHGHSFQYELTLSFSEMDKLDGSYAIDYSEIKRVGCQWVDDFFDHGSIVNPKDPLLPTLLEDSNNKVWVMSLYGKDNFCNPSSENIAKELFLATEILLNCYEENSNKLKVHNVRLYETPNCFTDCGANSLKLSEIRNFYRFNGEQIQKYREEKGTFQYDSRLVS